MEDYCTGIVITILILIIIGILIYFLFYSKKRKRKEYLTTTPGGSDGVLNDICNMQNDTPECGIDGCMWNEVIKNDDLSNTGVFETNADFVNKASKFPYATSALKFQEADHDRDPINYIGFRRYNHHGQTAALDGAQRRVTSERFSDYQPKPTISINFPTDNEVANRVNAFNPNEI